MLLEIQISVNGSIVLDGKATAATAHQIVKNYFKQNIKGEFLDRFTPPSLSDICVLRENQNAAPLGGMFENRNYVFSYYIGRPNKCD